MITLTRTADPDVVAAIYAAPGIREGVMDDRFPIVEDLDWATATADGHFHYLLVTRPGDDEPLGLVQLEPAGPRWCWDMTAAVNGHGDGHMVYAIHIAMLPEYRGRWAVAALRAGLAYGWAHTPARVITGRIAENNRPCMVVAAQAGMARGITEPRRRKINGRWLAEVVYTAVRADRTREQQTPGRATA